MRYSRLLIPTLREDPSEAEIISHRLMLRAGMIRKLSAGIYSYLPLGYRVLRKVEAIVREEMDRALRDGFTADEVAKDKAGYLQSRQLSRAQDEELASSLANALFAGRTLTYDAQLEQKIAALSPQEIVAALRRRLDWNKMSVVKAGDFAKKKPSAATP